MKRLVIFALVSMVAMFVQAQSMSGIPIRRNATITTNTTMVISSFTKSPVAPVTIALGYTSPTNGTVSFGVTMAGYYHALGTATVTNEVIVQLPLVWLRPDNGDSITIVNSNSAPVQVTIDFVH